MILQALCGYYRRACNQEKPEALVARPGYSTENVSGVILIDRDGSLVDVRPLRDETKTKPSPKPMMVPQPPKRAGQRPSPAFLYEKGEFIFGIYNNENGAQYRFDASREIHQAVLGDCDDEGARALLRFYGRRRMGSTEYASADTALLANPALFFVFQLQGDSALLHERPAIRAAWARYRARQSGDAALVQCLITGEIGPLMRLHGNCKGFGADKPTLVGFNQPSFCSFGRYGQQGANAPVCEDAAFAYVTAMNMLLTDPRHCVSLADTKLLFWAEQSADEEETLVGMFFGVREDSDGLDAAQRDRIRAVLGSVMKGANPQDQRLDPKVQFYILGVSANKTRLVVRLFHTSTFGTLLTRLAEHYRDLAVEGLPYGYPAPAQLLLETALEHKYENISPTLEPALVNSILNGTPYPDSLYQAILRRVRAEKTVAPLRAGILKACLNRKLNREAITVALNEEELDRAYLMGRLFAYFEFVQWKALGNVNASIVDKYLNAALATPQMVFPVLFTLSEKHINKSEDFWLKGKIAAVVDSLSMDMDARGRYMFPASLNANDQGKFLVGYYHQRQELFRKKGEAPKADAAQGEAAAGEAALA